MTRGVRTYKNHVNSSVDACISGHIKLEHVITCTFGCTNGEMHVESFSDALVPLHVEIQPTFGDACNEEDIG
jgi:hypothetical protein